MSNYYIKQNIFSEPVTGNGRVGIASEKNEKSHRLGILGRWLFVSALSPSIDRRPKLCTSRSYLDKRPIDNLLLILPKFSQVKNQAKVYPLGNDRSDVAHRLN